MARAYPKRISHGPGYTTDLTMAWIVADHPEMASWRAYAVAWIDSLGGYKKEKLLYMRIFLEDYIVRLNIPFQVPLFLKEGENWPSYVEAIAHKNLNPSRLKHCNDFAADFLSWIIAKEFSGPDEYGFEAPLRGFQNPIRRIQRIAERTIEDASQRPHNDKHMRWVTKVYPDMAEWRALAVEWLHGETGSTKPRLQALQCFVREFIIGCKLPTVPEEFFRTTTLVPDFFTVCMQERIIAFSRPWTNHIYNFTSWILLNKYSVIDEKGNRIIPEHLRNPITPVEAKIQGKTTDLRLGWVVDIRPDLEEWRRYGEEWLSNETRGLDIRLKGLVLFFDRYLIGLNLPASPSFLFARKSIIPDFYQTCCQTKKDGIPQEVTHIIQANNRVSTFLNWVLLKHFSYESDEGVPVISPAFRNPVPSRTNGGQVNRESVHSPLPFGFIEDMRLMLAQGPHFSDWTWAQSALGVEKNVTGGRDGGDWYTVRESDIDKDDPDCVWRLRTYNAGNSEFQMWSPVRWVAMLIKLQIPLRVLQVRLLDSGEADTWRYAEGAWSENKSDIAEGDLRRPLSQGVFRRVEHLSKSSAPLVMYVNTNKTADQKRSGPAKGYVVAWPSIGPIHQNPFYWAERLRNWQEKYNPIKRRTSWTELKNSHIPLKSGVQKASYPNACFLFRMRELSAGQRHLPLTVAALCKPWYSLLAALQARLHRNGESDSGDLPYSLVPPYEDSNRGVTTYFPLQSLRVSLITALALDGQVPFPILQKLVGHSRLLMTLYYTKMGPTYVGEQLKMAALRMEETKAGGIKRFIADASHESLLAKVVYNSSAGLMIAIAKDPGARNPAGWMLLHHGMCLVGGNTSEVEENGKVGGCHNGGPNIGTELKPHWSPVPGGSRNCPRCRWFVTQPQYLPSLVATFNNHAYHFDEARNKCLVAEEGLQEMKLSKFEVEAAGAIFRDSERLFELERIYEGAMKHFSDIAETLVATWRLIDRCRANLKSDMVSAGHLVAVGTLTDVSVAFDETESELLQLSGVCEDVEVFPDLEPGKAVFRRSQLLDLVLMREGVAPVFITMSEADQLACGNAFMRQLAQQVSPTNLQVGVRSVVEVIDSGAQVGKMLGLDLATLLPLPSHASSRVIPIRSATTLSENRFREP